MKLKVLQFIVGFLTIAIVVAVGLVGYGLARNAKTLDSKSSAAVTPVMTGDFGTLSLNQPDGTEITHMATVGNRVVVALKGGNQPPRVIVLDPATGAVTGTVTVTP